MIIGHRGTWAQLGSQSLGPQEGGRSVFHLTEGQIYKNSQEIILAKGSWEFSFSWSIPQNLPFDFFLLAFTWTEKDQLHFRFCRNVSGHQQCSLTGEMAKKRRKSEAKKNYQISWFNLHVSIRDLMSFGKKIPISSNYCWYFGLISWIVIV